MHPAFYVLIAFAIIIILGLIWGKKLRESKETVFIDFAHQYNLEIHTEDIQMGRIHISGKIDGIDFELKEEAVDLKQDATVWTYLRFKNSPFDFDFQITCDNLGMKLAKALGYDDVEIGNPDFDKKYVCHSKDAEKMKRFFDEIDQQNLLNLYDDIFGMLENKSDENHFEYVHQGRINRPFHMESLDRILQFMRGRLKKG